MPRVSSNSSTHPAGVRGKHGGGGGGGSLLPALTGRISGISFGSMMIITRMCQELLSSPVSHWHGCLEAKHRQKKTSESSPPTYGVLVQASRPSCQCSSWQGAGSQSRPSFFSCRLLIVWLEGLQCSMVHPHWKENKPILVRQVKGQDS